MQKGAHCSFLNLVIENDKFEQGRLDMLVCMNLWELHETSNSLVIVENIVKLTN